MGCWLGTGTIASQLLEYRPFEEARAFSRELGLKNANEWRKFCKGHLPAKGALPGDISANPHVTYKDKGWLNWGDWLGTGYVAQFLREYRPFEEARAFANGLGIKSQNEWFKFCKGQLQEKGVLPEDIPAVPYQTYIDKGWITWGDWLGTGAIASYLREYRPFEEARAFAHGLRLKNQHEWRKFCKGQFSEKGTLPEDIPAKPDKTYKDKGWLNWGDWLGTGYVAQFLREYRPFEEARAFVRGLGLKSQAEWFKFCKGQLPEKGTLPEDIPTVPYKTYKDEGWKSMGDWLGTGTIAPFLREHRPFEEARAFVRGLGLKSRTEWQKFCQGQLPEKGRLPPDVPAAPSRTYKDKGWLNWGDWLGTGTVAPRLKKYLPFEEARVFARGLCLKSLAEWRKLCKGQIPEKGTLPEDIPANPHQTYRDKGWLNWGDWLGTGAIASHLREYRPFEEARVFARGLGLKNVIEWRKFCKGQFTEKGTLPEDIPLNPNLTYKDIGWFNWGDWLGTGTVALRLREYRPFEEARAFAHGLGLKNQHEWRKFCKGQISEKGPLPMDIPAAPDQTYRDKGWLNWRDWLGGEMLK